MRLTLKKETLAQLSDEELADLAGASYRTKYECTESYQFCIGTVAVRTLAPATCLQTQLGACIPTQGC